MGCATYSRPNPVRVVERQDVNAKTVSPLYTPEQRLRRDQSVWTLVQGVLAPLQFLTFLVSLYLVADALFDQGRSDWANASVLVKTGLLYAIMVTGSIWEKVVFDCYLFAPAFYWEDVVSMGVMVLHTAYVVVWWLQLLTPSEQLWLALLAYASYLINAGQFLYKFRQARLVQAIAPAAGGVPLSALQANRGQLGGGRP